MILRGRIDGAVTDFETTDDCRGEHMFDDGKLCRKRVAFDTHAGYPVCGGATQLYYAAMCVDLSLRFPSPVSGKLTPVSPPGSTRTRAATLRSVARFARD